MIDAQTQTLLQGIIRRESRSLLRYVTEAYPWTTPGETEAFEHFKTLVQEEDQGAVAVARLLGRHHVPPPHLGAYPMHYTALNYIGFDSLLPRIVDNQRLEIAKLENDLVRISDPEIQSEVRKILAMKNQHLQVLESLAAAHPNSAAH